MMGIGRTSILFLGLLVLVMYCNPGGALKCVQCDTFVKSCSKNATCGAEQDTCLRVTSAGTYRYLCWKHADCKMEKIGEYFNLPAAQYYCCQDDMCNAAGTGATISQTVMLTGLLVVMVGSFHF